MPISNFRDFGGYASRFGGTVVRDRLYRSAVMAHASAAARERLNAYDFALIVDLRYRAEQEAEPAGWPANYEARLLMHGSDRESEAPHLRLLNGKVTDPALVDTFMLDYYRALPFDPLYRPLYATVLKRLADLDGRLLVHCTAGKDRTGLIVAMIHWILGVSADDVMDDFLRSARLEGMAEQVDAYVEPVSKQYGYPVPRELLFRLMQVQESYLTTARAEIIARSGSIVAYFDGMGADEALRSRLRSRLLV